VNVYNAYKSLKDKSLVLLTPGPYKKGMGHIDFMIPLDVPVQGTNAKIEFEMDDAVGGIFNSNKVYRRCKIPMFWVNVTIVTPSGNKTETYKRELVSAPLEYKYLLIDCGDYAPHPYERQYGDSCSLFNDENTFCTKDSIPIAITTMKGEKCPFSY
jgi:hypothetical protein